MGESVTSKPLNTLNKKEFLEALEKCNKKFNKKATPMQVAHMALMIGQISQSKFNEFTK